MFKRPTWKEALLALTLGIFSFSAQAAFNAGMTQTQVQAEISVMLSQTNPRTGQPYSLMDVANAAKTAGVEAGEFTSAVIAAGTNPVVAVTAAITAWGQAAAPAIAAAAITAAPGATSEVIRVANALAPDQTQAITTAALAVPGVDPAVVLAATAAGPATEGTIAALTAAAAAPGGGAGGGGGGGVASPA